MARKKKNRRNIERERAFLENGSRVLEKLIVSCNGRPSPIRSFSCEEIERATNNYDPRRIFHRDLLYEWYNGSFEGRMVSIKKYLKSFHEAVFTDIAISTKMSPHNNVLRFIGCCLETQIPTLVYKSAANGSLAYRWEVSNSSLNGEQQQREPMEWQSKLKIAREIAHAISYLHTAFSRPIIHRDIKQGNIFIDEHDVAKLTDFSQSISIPEGETHIVDKYVIGTLGFVCPYYGTTFRITEKIDVFSFGSFLLELTTGQRICHLVETADDEGVELEDYIENVIQAGKRGAVVEQQAQAVKLALLCREKDPEIRPNMVDVTKELRKIERDYFDVEDFEDDLNFFTINALVDHAILIREGGSVVWQQLQAVLQLAHICKENYPEIRPNMVDVTKELGKIERFIPLPPSKFLCKESILE